MSKKKQKSVVRKKTAVKPVLKKTAVQPVVEPVVAPIAKPEALPVQPAAETPVAKKNKSHQILGLVLNIILPGVGTLLCGGQKYKDAGIWQFVIAVISIPLCFIWIGIPIFIAMWIWALMTGINMIKEA